MAAVYSRVKETTNSRLKAIREIVDPRVADPFQLANVVIVGSFLAGRYVIREVIGFKAEDYGGNRGAGIESEIQSCDTAVAGQVAKGIAYAQIIIPARISVTDRNLRKLANQYDSTYFHVPHK